jgi:hypothetical protein
MQHFSALQPGLASLTRRLKSALDPNDVIAPGRYAG